MTPIEHLDEAAKRLRLYYTRKNIHQLILEAKQDNLSYLEFLCKIMDQEIENRDRRDFENRLSRARLPVRHNLDEFDYDFASGITKPQMSELRQLLWLDNAYNIILMGPSGTGKTFIAAGLVYEAVKAGKKGYLMTMEDIVTTLRMKDLSPSAMTNYRKIINADLIAIDDIMLMPVKKEEATAFFNLINTLYEKTSIIITTNKAPTEWTSIIDDEVIITALLDRLMYKCEVIKLTGKSYRLENRKTIFERK
jgi:DNA replication protein DnaC